MSGAEAHRRDDYDELVDWDRRLAREAPLFRALFAEAGVRSVADVGAGSGWHAIMFASWGLAVTAVDPDPWMLERARANVARAGAAVRVAPGALGEVAGILGSPVDAVTCTGNALPHVASREALRAALADLAAALRPGGVLVLHFLNHHRLVSQRVRTIKPVFRETPEGDRFFLRLMDVTPDGEHILFDFVTLTRDRALRDAPPAPEAWAASLAADPTGGWRVESRRSVHLVIDHRAIVAELAAAGFAEATVYGDHARKPLDEDADESIVVVAHR